MYKLNVHISCIIDKFMRSEKMCKAILPILISCNIVSGTFKMTNVSKQSHPMLASIFHVADKVRMIQENPDRQIPAGMDLNQRSGLWLDNAGSFERSGNVLPDQTSGNRQTISSDSASIIVSNMMCSVCQRRGDVACLKRLCMNTETNPSIMGNDSPPQFQPSVNQGFDFNSQLDRHDMLIQTSMQQQPEFNRGMGSHQNSGQVFTDGNIHPTNPLQFQGGNSAVPIWSMTAANVQDIGNGMASQGWLSAENIPLGMSEKHRPVDVVRTHNVVSLAESAIPGQKHPNTLDQTVAFPAANTRVGSAILPEQSTGIVGGGPINTPIAQIPVATPVLPQQFTENMGGGPLNFPVAHLPVGTANLPQQSTGNVGGGPIDLSTDILRQIVENSENLDTVLRGNINMHSAVSPEPVQVSNSFNNMIFPDGFVDNHQGSPITTTNRDANRNSDIAVATDVFSGIVPTDSVQNRHTLVVKDHGGVEKLGILDTNQPIVSGSIRLLETSGRIVNRDNDPNLGSGLHFSGSAVDHSHQGHNNHNNAHTAVDVLNDLMNLAMQNGSLNNNNVFTTTTPIPTMDPKRRTELQNWSKQLLKRL